MKTFGTMTGDLIGTMWPNCKGVILPSGECFGIMGSDCKGVIGTGDGYLGIIISGD